MVSQQRGGREGKGLWVGPSEGLPGRLHTPALAHLVEGVEVPFAHVLLEDPRLRREGQLGYGLGSGPMQGTPPRAPRPMQAEWVRWAWYRGCPLRARDLPESLPCPQAQAAGPTFSSR